MKKQQIKVDEKIMAELLEQPEVKLEVAKMTPEVLALYKDLLVSEGIYQQYVREQGKK